MLDLDSDEELEALIWNSSSTANRMRIEHDDEDEKNSPSVSKCRKSPNLKS